MVSHLVIMKPRRDLSAPARERLVTAFEHAIREIPTVKSVRVGRRVRIGAGYEAVMPDAADYFVLIDFDDVAGLAAYLQHPAHKDLGARFSDSLEAALVFDFEGVGLDRLREL
jgi:stress responsive alpha/beta barrel protein